MARGPLETRENGLFVWRADNLYSWDERLDGKTYSRITLAEKAAAKRNAAGEHGGMIVVRPRNLVHETAASIDHHRRRHRSLYQNPPLVAFANPGRKLVSTLSNRVYAVQYRHADDFKDYQHKFGAGVCMELLSDGSVRLYHRDGKPLFQEF